MIWDILGKVRDISKRVRVSSLSFAATLLAVYGIALLFVYILPASMHLRDGIPFWIWVPIFIGILYVLLAAVLQDVKEWSYYTTLVILALGFAFFLGSVPLCLLLSWDYYASLLSLVNSVIHAALLAYILIGEKEVTWKPPVKEEKITLGKREVSDLRCKECGSDDLLVFRDGSAKCNDCLKVFSNIWESSDRGTRQMGNG